MGLGELINHKNLKIGKLSADLSLPPFCQLATKWGKKSTFSTVFEKHLETPQMGPICPQGPPEVDHHKVKSPREGKIPTTTLSPCGGHIPISFSKPRRNWKKVFWPKNRENSRNNYSNFSKLFLYPKDTTLKIWNIKKPISGRFEFLHYIPPLGPKGGM